jgi:hypothetical protein
MRRVIAHLAAAVRHGDEDDALDEGLRIELQAGSHPLAVVD